MKLPRNVSGKRLAEHLCRQWGYVWVRQVGSHIVLRTEQPTGKTVSVPEHSPLRTGTLGSILGQVAVHKGMTRDDILRNL